METSRSGRETCESHWERQGGGVLWTRGRKLPPKGFLFQSFLNSFLMRRAVYSFALKWLLSPFCSSHFSPLVALNISEAEVGFLVACEWMIKQSDQIRELMTLASLVECSYPAELGSHMIMYLSLSPKKALFAPSSGLHGYDVYIWLASPQITRLDTLWDTLQNEVLDI